MILPRDNYVESERLFSTGDSELDDLLEEVYYSGISDGYDYAQREFSEEKKKDKMSRADRLGIATTAGIAGGGSIAAEIAGLAAEKKARREWMERKISLNKYLEKLEKIEKKTDRRHLATLIAAAPAGIVIMSTAKKHDKKKK